MRVIIDDKEFIPANVQSPKIGIAITTRNREDVVAQALQNHEKWLPNNAVVYVIDDGSTKPFEGPSWVKVVRHEESRGIPASKNTCLAALADEGCEHFFLWDDDAWPIADGWWERYVDSPEAHLSYQFADLKVGTKMNDFTVIYTDGDYIAYSGQRGVMLYYKREVLDKVGGFDMIYERGMYEHLDFALRIHNAGMTTCPFGDFVGSDKWIYSMDEHCAVQRSVPPGDRRALAERNVKIYDHRRRTYYAGYAPFRPVKRVVIGALLTSTNDPQRNKTLVPKFESVQNWANSIRGAEKVLIADQMNVAPGCELVKVPCNYQESPYMLRWVHIYQWLRDHPEVSQVWCTDTTDVVMLKEPWDAMEEGKVYVGSEHSTYSDPWFMKHANQQEIKNFITQNAQRQVLNVGLLGGSREDVMGVVHRMIQLHWSLRTRLFTGEENGELVKLDMFHFIMALEPIKDRVVFGPNVNTVFKTNGVGKDFAWFTHK